MGTAFVNSELESCEKAFSPFKVPNRATLLILRDIGLEQGEHLKVARWEEMVEEDGRLLLLDREAYWDVLDGRVEDGLLDMLQ